ncbi:MAG: UTP--glucose-1-phosphate uridylyltransferase [bacterium]
MAEQEIINRVVKAGQEQVFRFWNELDAASRKKLLLQLKEVNFSLLSELYQKFIQKTTGSKIQAKLEPADFINIPKTSAEIASFQKAKEIGESALREGRVAAFLVAGGQGTRLGYDGPKGMFPFTPIKKKSLFQLYGEKIKASSKKYGVSIPWYIMTSETNHQQSIDFFESHAYFGLQARNVKFFQQQMIPALDPQGRLMLDAKDHIFTNPNGHGGSLAALKRSGALDDMRTRGIDLIFYFQVDNVLVNICDPIFIGLHLQNHAQMSAKVVSKDYPDEKLGVLGKINGRLGVIEYSDLSDEESRACNSDGNLKFRAGNLAIHVFDVEFIEQLNQGGLQLPWHVAHKKIPHLNEHGDVVQPDAPNGYKFETFVFDALSYAEKTTILEVSRAEEFSPVKNARGVDSPDSARRDMINLFGRWLEKAGVQIPRDSQNNVQGVIEISPLFALDEEELMERIKPDFKFDGCLYLNKP